MRRARRGAQAVEIALLLPIYLSFFGAIVDFGQYNWMCESMVAAVSAGARAGANGDRTEGADALRLATEAAATSWAGSGMPEVPLFTASYEGQAPEQRIVVQGTLAFEPLIGLVPLPDRVAAVGTLRMTVQPR